LIPRTALFAVAFPHLTMLVRHLSDVQLQHRARAELLAQSALVLRRLNAYEFHLNEDVTQTFISVVSDKRLADRFDPSWGTIEAYFQGIMYFVALACLRQRRRLFYSLDIERLGLLSRRLDPTELIAQKDMLQHIRGWVGELTEARREAMYRRYDALEQAPAHREPVSTDSVNRHRAIKELRVKGGIAVTG
jgi:hypothetical protein